MQEFDQDNYKDINYNLKFLIHYGEIGLKGKNRSSFEKILVSNIKRKLKNLIENREDFLVKREKGRIVLYSFDKHKDRILKVLKNTFGIVNFSIAFEVEKDIEKIKQKVDTILDEFREKYSNKQTIAFKTKRADKTFEYISPQVNNILKNIAISKGFDVDYKQYDREIFVEISHKNCFIYTEKIKGLGGLPVGSTGRVLVLLSGGIDSPIAAFKLMKRGCSCDFLHVHNLISNDLVKKSKIVKSLKILNRFQAFSNLYVAPYKEFEFSLFGKRVDNRYELILFKHYILKLAQKILEKEGYDAIVTGDSLAQVASQTIENLNVVSKDINCLIFRPLLSFDKEEIIKISKEIDLFDLSVEDYKDCCSLVSKNPITKAKYEKFKIELGKIDLDNITNKTLEESLKLFITDVNF